MKLYLEAGKVINKHGYKGAVKLECWCDTPKVLASLPFVYRETNSGFETYTVLSASVQKRFVLMTLSGVDSEEKADALRGVVLFASRSDLPEPEGGYFIADLIGLPALDADTGKKLGTVSDIYENASGQLYEIKTDNGTALVPAAPAFIISCEPGVGVRIRPIPGMFDEAENADI